MASPTITSPIKNVRKVVVVSSLVTLFEWYDFCIYSSLATVIAGEFYPHSNPGTALLAVLTSFAVGLIARPFGALVFGRLGDRSGRKHALGLTMVIMAVSTFAIGLIPGYTTIGIAAPILLLLFRLIQGLAMGGVFGGAANYVAEYVPERRLGFYTSWTQAAAPMGLFLSVGVILLLQHGLDADAARSMDKFNGWGWRIPFLLSGLLMIFWIYFRLKMQESPLFDRLKQEGRVSKSPLAETFGRKSNLKLVLLAIFGVTMGQGVVFYASVFQTQNLLEGLLDASQSKQILLLAILLAAPFFVLFGGWSDRIGRKWIMLAGMLLAVATYPFAFRALSTIPQTQGRVEFTTEKEILSTVAFIDKSKDVIHISNAISHYEGGLTVTQTSKDTIYASGRTPVTKPVVTVSTTLSGPDYWKMVAIAFVLILAVAMVYGPMAAFLTELFPANIRYTAVSFAAEAGAGIFGAITPLVAMLIVAGHPGNLLSGLWYPMGLGALCVIIGAILIPRRSQNAEFQN